MGQLWVRVGAFVVAGVVSLSITPLVREYALRRGLVDAVSDRKLHSGRIPRLGGVAIVLAFYATTALVFEFALAEPAHAVCWAPYISTILGGLLIAGLGLYDDLRGADASTKFGVQIVAAAIVCVAGVRIQEVFTPFGSFSLGVLSLPFTVFWIVGVTNAVNLIDGLDGLAGGVGVIALLGIAVLAWASGKQMALVLAVTLAGAIGGFLFYNFHPASIFMGDIGSLFTGFLIAATSLIVCRVPSGTNRIDMTAAVFVVGLPVWDTVLAIIRRSVRGTGLFSADREHLHHRLLRYGLSQRTAALVMCSAMLVLVGIAWSLHHVGSKPAALILMGSGVVILLATYALGYADVFRSKSAFPHDIDFEVAICNFVAAIAQIESHEQLATEFSSFGATLRLRPRLLALREGEEVVFEWSVTGGVPRRVQPTSTTAAGANDLVTCAWHDDPLVHVDQRRRINDALLQAAVRLRSLKTKSRSNRNDPSANLNEDHRQFDG